MTLISDARARAEAELTCTGRITRPSTGPATIDPVTLARTDPAPALLWEGPASAAPMGGQGAEDERAGRQQDGRVLRVAVPVDGTGAARRGDTFTVTAVDEDGDPALVGVPFAIEEVTVRSRMVLRRLRCIDTAGTAGRFT